MYLVEIEDGQLPDLNLLKVEEQEWLEKQKKAKKQDSLHLGQ